MNSTLIASVLKSAIRAGTPLLYATVGEIYAERSGIMNLGVEGMMIMGAVSGYGVGIITGNPWLAILTAGLVGALMGLIHSVLSINFRVNQVVSGLALTMFGLGLSSLAGAKYIGVPKRASLTTVKIPFLSKIPVIGEVLFNQDPIVYASFIVVPFLWFFLFKTKAGIIIRSVGENPAAADALGVKIYLVRHLCTVFGGFMAGLAGAYLSVVYTPAWVENMTAGRGWIAVALTIFSLWNPLRAMLGAYLFGGVEAVQFNLQAYGIPPDILGMMPYLLTILVMVFGAEERIRKRLGAPSALGVPYVRGEK
ncbi:MAG: ABC transporter permease [Thermoproteota archaeon]|nr:MAG: ABC transporter permease [Candidatus Korarchaeota archaeon]